MAGEARNDKASARVRAPVVGGGVRSQEERPHAILIWSGCGSHELGNI
jgi:hypothetical protein